MNLLLLAGTTEGRELAEALLLREMDALTVCVATEYGASLLPRHPKLTVRIGRLDEAALQRLLREQDISHAIDATHPYAVEATRNLYRACQETGTPYLRLLRKAQGTPDSMSVANVQQAAAFLNTVPGRVLLTTGSKELSAFTAVRDYRERLFARVLPTASVLAQCEALGFSGKHLIAMQGPFSEALNEAILRQIGASWLVTKDSGIAGGLVEKCRAAHRAGAKVLCIGRPAEPQEGGYSLEEILALLFPDAPGASGEAAYFPLFVPLQNRRVVVVGAGSIAARRVQALLPFGCSLTVIAPESRLPPHPNIHWIARPYAPGDAGQADLVLAATNDSAVNHAVFLECQRLGIPCNAADCPQECSFLFPALIQQGSVVIGVTSGGADHALVKRVAARIRSRREEIFSLEKGEWE